MALNITEFYKAFKEKNVLISKKALDKFYNLFKLQVLNENNVISAKIILKDEKGLDNVEMAKKEFFQALIDKRAAEKEIKREKPDMSEPEVE